MSEKLTKAQAAVLAHGKDIYFRPITRRAHLIADSGFSIKVNIATFNSLSLKGYIKCERSPGSAVQLWRITDLGRTALTDTGGGE